tara:strand:+ start:620 stop:1393 length:774 start_codon:yes stop_codon:yes gene_type:complete
MLSIEYKATKELIPYINNSRTHSEQQVQQVAASIKEFGFTNPLLVDEQGGIIAGHGRLLAAQMLGMDEVPTITLKGLTEAQRKAYVIADNQLALNAGWDLDLLKIEIDGLSELDFDVDLLGFDDEFLDELLDLVSDSYEEENPYTGEIKAPTYEPNGEKPEITELTDLTYTAELIDKINKSDLPSDEKVFLTAAATRHSVFNFDLIADYYSHSKPDVQQLMEDSALVIIDYDAAIANGFVNINRDLSIKNAEENLDG